MKTTKKWLTAVSFLGLSTFFFACNKDGAKGTDIPAGKSQLSVHMMDDPIQFSKVLIDIRQVTVLVDTATTQADADDNHQWDDNWCGWHRHADNKSLIWDTLNITPGVYDLLQLRNGADTLLGTGLFTTGKIIKIRVTLGSDNKVYTDSATSYPLEVFGPQPFFTINVRREDVASITNNQFELWLDFNLAKSVFFWNGTFLLKPFFTVFNDVKFAKIDGTVLPEHASTLVAAYTGNDTIYAIPRRDGYYKFRGVAAGTYSVNFKGHDGYQDTTINNIVVDSGQATHVPAITLHQ